jgi:UPF0755 protein
VKKKRLAIFLIVIGLLGYIYLERELNVVHIPSSTDPIEIPAGLSARGVLSLLREQNLIANEKLTLVYVVLSGNRKALRAGEYLFDRPMTTHQVINKLVAGEIHLHHFTIPEGLTVAEVASRWEEQGFGKTAEFLDAATNATDLVQDLDGEPKEGVSLEGYLFPETYSFPLHTSPRQAIEAMVGRFRSVLAQLNSDVPSELWPLGVRDTIILASLVEAEAAVDEERPLIASVYLNRLKKKILLQCDPTVIYALEKSNKYEGRLTLNDLKFDSRYNTYRYPGLPPGPIANPGLRALEAATRPASTPYIFFVRTTEGRHTFSENLAAHNRAVAAYRVQQKSAQQKPQQKKK